MLPSEHSQGKPAHDEDFRAGFAAGVKSLGKPSKKTADELYRKVSKQHGYWWINGYNAAVMWHQGLYNTADVMIARVMGLSLTPPPKVVRIGKRMVKL